jgi:hypothetical protein
VSSSGLIYAGIVGAWAVYLVPVWLRREEQLNEARKKARYAAAIRALGRTEQFERRWLTEEALAATGTDGHWRPPGRAPGKPSKAGPPDSAQDKHSKQVKQAKQPQPTKSATSSTTAAAKKSPTAQPARRLRPTSAAHVAPTSAVAAERQRHRGVTARIPRPQERAASSTQQRQQVRRRGVLLMRRRRVVAFLFTLATAGAAVSAVLGVSYIWAMLVPATLFSAYIVNIRRDERLRAEERYRRRQAALAAERRRERQRLLTEDAATAATAAAAVAGSGPTRARRRAGDPPQDFRRAANG